MAVTEPTSQEPSSLEYRFIHQSEILESFMSQLFLYLTFRPIKAEAVSAVVIPFKANYDPFSLSIVSSSAEYNGAFISGIV